MRVLDRYEMAARELQEHYGFNGIVDLNGEFHRFHIDGDKRGTKNGWYVGDESRFVHGNWKTGASSVLKFNGTSTARDFANIKREQERRKREQAAAKRQRQHKAIQTLHALLRRAEPAWKSHPYLRQKPNLAALGLKQVDNYLLVLMQNTAGELVNAQRIYPDGNKRYLAGGQIAEAFHLIGKLTTDGEALFCEGWATGMAVHMATRLPVVCAMSAKQMQGTAIALKRDFPKLKITVCGDDDRRHPQNPGRTSANAAALAIGAGVTFPKFCCDDCDCSDFDDVSRCPERQGGDA